VKTALVTGTTSGIGRELVKGLLAAGYAVIAHARSADKLEAELATWTPRERVSGVLAALDVQADVLRMADEVAARAPKLDLLVHNAAVSPTARVETAEGLDACFVTNVLAPFLLTRRLEPQLRAASPARVIFFFGGNYAELDVADLAVRKTPKYKGFNIYSESKNACALLARAFGKRLDGSGVSVFAVLPGLVDTEGMRGLGFPFSMAARLFFRTPSEGARTPLWVADEPGLEAKSGHCFGNVLGNGWRNETQLPAVASDDKLAEQVYTLCVNSATAVH
jgi:NAD(P)-dependent dehydrogenase (short-subunit alcohol dehydrogenase family)